MKCPKCGSELDTGFNCPNCGYKRYEVAVSKTELTTAEMLLWLIKNIPLDCNTQNIAFAFGWKEEVFGGDIESQIKQAYDWLTKQDVKE